MQSLQPLGSTWAETPNDDNDINIDDDNDGCHYLVRQQPALRALVVRFPYVLCIVLILLVALLNGDPLDGLGGGPEAQQVQWLGQGHYRVAS